MDDLKGDMNVESDCEGGTSGAGPETPEVKEKKDKETRAVLITGSFLAYALFPFTPTLE